MHMKVGKILWYLNERKKAKFHYDYKNYFSLFIGLDYINSKVEKQLSETNM